MRPTSSCVLVALIPSLSVLIHSSIRIHAWSFQRRNVLQSVVLPVMGWWTTMPSEPEPSSVALPSTSITIPMEYLPRLSAYVVRYTLGTDDAMVYTAIVDTGSPFLTVPSFCDQIVWDSPKQWGCFDRITHNNTPYAAPTMERFDNNQGRVDWRTAVGGITFVNATTTMPSQDNNNMDELIVRSSNSNESSIVFGVLDGSLLGGSGGVFLGLIREVQRGIRPSFLGQTRVQSMVIDFRTRQLTLLSSSSSSEHTTNNTAAIPLVDDLRRYGDPTLHYTAQALHVRVNGRPIVADKRPIYVIFDTGVTGMVVSAELWEERNRVARQNRERSLWGTVEMDFGRTTLRAEQPLTTPLGTSPPWPGFRGHLIVAGLAFLDHKTLTIEMTNKRLWVE